MSFGINLQASNGDIAFTTDYPSLQYYGKYTLTQGGVNFNYPAAVFTVTCPSWPTIFIKDAGDTSLAYCQGSTADNGNGTYTVWIHAYYGTPSTIYVFAHSDTVIPTTGYGINTFDANGGLNFSTQRKALKITGYVITVPFEDAYTSPGYDYPVIGTLTSNCALHVPSLGIWSPGAPFGNPLMLVGATKLNSTTIRSKRTGYIFAGLPNNVFAFRNTGNQYIMAINTDDYD